MVIGLICIDTKISPLYCCNTFDMLLLTFKNLFKNRCNKLDIQLLYILTCIEIGTERFIISKCF